MNVKLIRYWHIENCPDEPATDYGLDAILPDGRRYYVVTAIRHGDCNPEGDDRALCLASTLEHKVKGWHFTREDTYFSYEEAEIEVTDRELNEIVQVGSPIGVTTASS